MGPRDQRISLWRPDAGTADNATGMNAGVVPSCCWAWRIHLCARFAFTMRQRHSGDGDDLLSTLGLGPRLQRLRIRPALRFQCNSRGSAPMSGRHAFKSCSFHAHGGSEKRSLVRCQRCDTNSKLIFSIAESRPTKPLLEAKCFHMC